MINKLRFHLKSFLNSNFYDSDGLYTIHNSGFKKLPNFISAYNLGADTGSWGEDPKIEWRVHVVLWAAQNGLKLEGDFVECGVNKGGFCKAIINYLDFNNSNKTFWLFDSFEGQFNFNLLPKNETDKIKLKKYNYGDYSEFVVNQFKDDKVRVVKGLVPESLSSYNGNKLAFLSIDMNSTSPEIEALEFFWDKLTAGAIVVLDDYAYYSHDDQYNCLNEYCQSKGVFILSLPTGQGLIIKQ